MKVRWVKQRLHAELDVVREEEEGAGHGLHLDLEVINDCVVSPTEQMDVDTGGDSLPEYGDRIRHTDQEPYWIPGAFPTIFQNETGDPHNYVWRKPEMKSWGPHIMRSRGWHAQAHTTFCYWWLNMVQRSEALSAKKWYLRDNPKANGYTLDALRNMSVKALAKNMVGYTAKIPGTQASKAQLRRIIFAMVRQIEIETASMEGAQERNKKAGDVPSLFGTLTTQRYHWEQIQQIIAQVEGKNYKELSKSKRRELVNKYPLFVSWYCAVRLELILKTVVVPLYGANAYVSVFEWNPTGGMVHLHYILWKKGAPRFDLQADSLLERAKALRKAGLVAGGEVSCDIKYVVDFFADYISEWNPNKTPQGEDKKSYVAEDVNQKEHHIASLSVQEMLDLLRGENPHKRYAYYERAVRTEHQHDFHHPDPLGPPNPMQPCAKLLKGTVNLWCCGEGYPRDLVCEPGDRSVAQDTTSCDLWRVNLCRNCQLTNPHMPLVAFGIQSNSNSIPVVTRQQAENIAMYCCKYCSIYCSKGTQCVLHEIMDEMDRRDTIAREHHSDTYKASTLGGQLHRAFMAEIGSEMCQAQVAHYANRMPEYLVSRDVKYVHLYRELLTNRTKSPNIAVPQDPEADACPGTKLLDVNLYERRCWFKFWPSDVLSVHLPKKNSPDEQILDASLWDFFRLVRYRGGKQPYLQWYDPAEWPVVVMSPTVKLTEGASFAFNARWALMQFHPWVNRDDFLEMADTEVKQFFREWRKTDLCPWYVKEQYLEDNGQHARGGAGPAGKKRNAQENGSGALPPDEYDAKIAAHDFTGAAVLQHQQRVALGEVEPPLENVSDEDAMVEGIETEHSSSAEEKEYKENDRETRVLKMLYKGNMEEIPRREQQEKSAKVYNRKHKYYRNSSSAEESNDTESDLRAAKCAKKATPLMHCPQCDRQYSYWDYRASIKR